MVMNSSNRRMLVVGNGFDLAHGLPTRYQDMLDAHLDILRSLEPNCVVDSYAIDSILIQLKNNNKTKT